MKKFILAALLLLAATPALAMSLLEKLCVYTGWCVPYLIEQWWDGGGGWPGL